MRSKNEFFRRIGIRSSIVGFVTVIITIQPCNSQQQQQYPISIKRPDPYKKWSHEISLESGMTVKWDSNDRNYLTMEMSAPARGYVGIGFSPSGGMAGADIVIGWVDSRGVPYLMDCHADSEGPPITDLQQDYELVSAEQLDNRTTIGFRRRWDTCDDKYDMRIGNDTIRMIWAYHWEDPVTRPFLHHHYHGPVTRGVRSVYMRTHSSSTRFPDSDINHTTNQNTRDSQHQYNGDKNVKNWDIAMRNVRIDGRKSSYICKLIKFPRSDRKHHLIGFRPMVTPGNAANVHHISLYLCQLPSNFGDPVRIFESYLQIPEQECYSHVTPADWLQYCSTFIFAWGIGSEGEMLPQHVGIPLGQSGDGRSTYFKFEIHYDNPAMRSFFDNSGMRVFYTENLRQLDASTLFLGHRVTPFQMIPQSQDNFMVFGFCSKECTQQGISSPNGLRIISVLLHGHQAAKNIRLRHIRNNKELPPIVQDNKYDYKYQQFRVLPNEINILPGDELIVECNYDTSNRAKTTFGGFSAKEEICQAIALYYPPTNFSDCRSQPEFYSFFGGLGINNVSGELLNKFNLPYDDPVRPKFLPQQNIFGNSELLPPDNSFQMIRLNEKDLENPFDYFQITSPFHRHGMSVGEYLRRINWKDDKLVRRLENSWKNGYHYMFCGQAGQRSLPIKSRMVQFPKFEKYQEYRRPECRYGFRESRGSNKMVKISVLINIISACFLF